MKEISISISFDEHQWVSMHTIYNWWIFHSLPLFFTGEGSQVVGFLAFRSGPSGRKRRATAAWSCWGSRWAWVFWGARDVRRSQQNTRPGKRLHFAIENHHVQWENPLFRLGHWKHSYVTVITRGYMGHTGNTPGIELILPGLSGILLGIECDNSLIVWPWE